MYSAVGAALRESQSLCKDLNRATLVFYCPALPANPSITAMLANKSAGK